eukprot:scaffold1099_cov122-Isochrysis_galbana.AAC.2
MHCPKVVARRAARPAVRPRSSVAAAMISQLFILAPNGHTIVNKDYRGDVPKDSAEIFLRKLVEKSGGEAPIFNVDGVNYMCVRKSGLFFLATTLHNVPPAYVIELLTQLTKVRPALAQLAIVVFPTTSGVGYPTPRLRLLRRRRPQRGSTGRPARSGCRSGTRSRRPGPPCTGVQGLHRRVERGVPAEELHAHLRARG